MNDHYPPFPDDLCTYQITTTDKTEHTLQVKGPELYYGLQDFDNFLRSAIKHGGHPEEVEAAYQDARDKLREMVGDPWEEF